MSASSKRLARIEMNRDVRRQRLVTLPTRHYENLSGETRGVEELLPGVSPILFGGEVARSHFVGVNEPAPLCQIAKACSYVCESGLKLWRVDPKHYVAFSNLHSITRGWNRAYKFGGEAIGKGYLGWYYNLNPLLLSFAHQYLCCCSQTHESRAPVAGHGF